MLTNSDRVHEIDKKFDADVRDAQFKNHFFLRLVARKRKFTGVHFEYSIFDTCYLRDCVFDTCYFTGCRFVGSNFHGSTFSGCTFEYAYFEKTIIDSSILNTECPGRENLKLKFARTLRVNYKQLGEAESVNRAIGVELAATEIHLHKAWRSNESYYRDKYKKFKRALMFLEWFKFKILDFIWGNGESSLKLLRAFVFFLVFMTLIDGIKFKDPLSIKSYVTAFYEVPQIFLGVLTPGYYPKLYLTFIVFIRLVTIGFFMAILIKRFNKR